MLLAETTPCWDGSVSYGAEGGLSAGLFPWSPHLETSPSCSWVAPWGAGWRPQPREGPCGRGEEGKSWLPGGPWRAQLIPGPRRAHSAKL